MSLVEEREIPIEDTAQETTPAGAWDVDIQGREYTRAVGRRGIIYRQGDETVQEALARDQQPRDQRPRKKPAAKKPPAKPAPPSKQDLKDLEELLANALKAPAIPAAALGDVWAADHFTNWGPYVARNLVLASEQNPWLRRKLENAASGGDMLGQIAALVGVGGALAMYALPPLVWWLNLPVPERGRQMLGIPDKQAQNGNAQAAPAAAAAAAS